MKNLCYILAITLILPSCFPADLKEKMNDQMNKMQITIADQAFRGMLGEIELHKLRTGKYPASLSDLQFLNSFDSAHLSSVEYHLLDSGYELNLNMKAATLNGKQTNIVLSYPKEFWHGLGCIKSNLKED
ncbi:MAG: hypothetical protein JNK18_04920 [Cyclobacteriaceae bacterium]|nr:hypothetical protein [Cyclobacteriaceae bacterium]